MFDFIKRMFQIRKKNKHIDENKNLGAYTPLNVRLTSTVTIDDTSYMIYPDIDKNIFRGDDYSVDAIIEQTVFGSEKLYRVQVDRDAFLMVSNTDVGTVEVIVFHKVNEVYPQTPSEWNEWIDKNDGMLYSNDIVDSDDVTYQKFWATVSQNVAKVITLDNETTVDYSTMVFSRDIKDMNGSDTQEFLLVDIVDNGVINMYTGVVIDSSNIKVL